MNKSYVLIQKNDLLIYQVMEKYGYFPKTSFYNNKNQNTNNQTIVEYQNFQILFPNFTTFFKNLDINFSHFIIRRRRIRRTRRRNRSGEKKLILNNEIKSFILNNIDSFDSEIKSFIGDYWTSLYKNVKSHIIIFLYLVNVYITDKLNNYDKNIMYWAILFHDTGKFQEMNKYYKEDYSINKRKDKSHPFKSAIIFIQTLLNKNLIFFQDKKEKEDFIKFFQNEFTDAIYKSFVKENNNNYNFPLFYNISFKNFYDIKKFLLNLKTHKQNKWVYDILILIIFHQSLPNNDSGKYVNSPLLDNKYIKKFFNVRLLELMRIILIYDSSSYCLFDGNWAPKIDLLFDRLINELYK